MTEFPTLHWHRCPYCRVRFNCLCIYYKPGEPSKCDREECLG